MNFEAGKYLNQKREEMKKEYMKLLEESLESLGCEIINIKLSDYHVSFKFEEIIQINYLDLFWRIMTNGSGNKLKVVLDPDLNHGNYIRWYNDNRSFNDQYFRTLIVKKNEGSMMSEWIDISESTTTEILMKKMSSKVKKLKKQEWIKELLEEIQKMNRAKTNNPGINSLGFFELKKFADF